MKVLFYIFLVAMPVFALSGCGDSGPKNIVKDATQEELDNYDKLMAEAESDLASDEESGSLGE